MSIYVSDVREFLGTLKRIADALEAPRKEPIVIMVPSNYDPDTIKQFAESLRKALNE